MSLVYLEHINAYSNHHVTQKVVSDDDGIMTEQLDLCPSLTSHSAKPYNSQNELVHATDMPNVPILRPGRHLPLATMMASNPAHESAENEYEDRVLAARDGSFNKELKKLTIQRASSSLDIELDQFSDDQDLSNADILLLESNTAGSEILATEDGPFKSSYTSCTADASERINLEKPNMSYACLIMMALESRNNQMMTLSEIYDWIKERFPYFQTAAGGWKNSIRHNLSLHKAFARVIRPSSSPGKGSYWKLATGDPCEIQKVRGPRRSRSQSLRDQRIRILSGKDDNAEDTSFAQHSPPMANERNKTKRSFSTVIRNNGHYKAYPLLSAENNILAYSSTNGHVSSSNTFVHRTSRPLSSLPFQCLSANPEEDSEVCRTYDPANNLSAYNLCHAFQFQPLVHQISTSSAFVPRQDSPYWTSTLSAAHPSPMYGPQNANDMTFSNYVFSSERAGENYCVSGPSRIDCGSSFTTMNGTRPAMTRPCSYHYDPPTDRPIVSIQPLKSVAWTGEETKRRKVQMNRNSVLKYNPTAKEEEEKSQEKSDLRDFSISWIDNALRTSPSENRYPCARIREAQYASDDPLLPNLSPSPINCGPWSLQLASSYSSPSLSCSCHPAKYVPPKMASACPSHCIERPTKQTIEETDVCISNKTMLEHRQQANQFPKDDLSSDSLHGTEHGKRLNKSTLHMHGHCSSPVRTRHTLGPLQLNLKNVQHQKRTALNESHGLTTMNTAESLSQLQSHSVTSTSCTRTSLTPSELSGSVLDKGKKFNDARCVQNNHLPKDQRTSDDTNDIIYCQHAIQKSGEAHELAKYHQVDSLGEEEFPNGPTEKTNDMIQAFSNKRVASPFRSCGNEDDALLSVTNDSTFFLEDVDIASFLRFTPSPMPEPENAFVL